MPNSPTPPLSSLRPPTQRDLLIYRKVKLSREPQWSVAHDHKLHYTRVSQIVKKVHRWLAAGGSPIDPELRNHLAGQRLARAAHRLRLERAVELASIAVEADLPVHKTTRRRVQGGTELWREEVSRDRPEFNLPALRFLLRATIALGKFDERSAFPAEPQQTSRHELLRAIFGLLCSWRTHAEANGCVAATPHIPTLIAHSLQTILGADLSDLLNPASTSSPEPLNLSAQPQDAAAPNQGQSTCCANSNSSSSEKSSQLESPVSCPQSDARSNRFAFPQN